MSMKYLGESFDIHTGGVDNMFPHHENEIAQSEAATGKTFVKYWMHCGYLVVDGAKMSKSLGNFYTLRQVMEKGYTGREIRYVLMSCQYRQPLNFTFEACEAARVSLDRLVEFRARVAETASGMTEGKAPAWAAEAEGRFRAALEDDLNVPEALGALFDMVHVGNREMDGGRLEPGEAAGVLAVLGTADSVLGVLHTDEAAGPGVDVMALVEQREQVRAKKDWAESDRLRDEIASLGWEVRDTPQGQKLKGIRS